MNLVWYEVNNSAERMTVQQGIKSAEMYFLVLKPAEEVWYLQR